MAWLEQAVTLEKGYNINLRCDTHIHLTVRLKYVKIRRIN